MDGQPKIREIFGRKTTVNDRKTSSLRPYCVLTGCLLISYPVRHLELSTDKGTKNARETTDMVMCQVGRRMAFFCQRNKRKDENLILYEAIIFVFLAFFVDKEKASNESNETKSS